MRALFTAFLFAADCLALPVSFEKRDSAHYIARFSQGMAVIGSDSISLAGVRLRFVGGAQSPRLEGLGPAAPSTYLRAGFTRTFQQFPRLIMHDLYPGVDAIFYGTSGNPSNDTLEYDLQLTSAAAVARIRISVEGSQTIAIDRQGNLTIRTANGLLRQRKPRVFQHGREIAAQYVLHGTNVIGLQLGPHDRQASLTIDPVLESVKSVGGTGLVNLLATDAQGNLYVAGSTSAVDFPTASSSLQPSSFPPLRALSNGGQTVDSLRVSSATNTSIVRATADGRILYAATSQGLFLSGDSGGTWRQTATLPVPGASNGSRTVSITGISIDSFDPATILVATNAGLFGSNSGGQFWGQRTTGLNVSGSGFVSMAAVFNHPANPLIAYAITSGPSYLFTSADAGNTWTRLNPYVPGETAPQVFTFSPNLAATPSADGSVLYAINGNGTLVKSGDGGSNWTRLASGFFGPLSIQIDPTNPSTIYVLDQQRLSKSSDGGVTFANITVPVSPRTLAIDSSGAVYTAGLFSPIYVSTDGARSFSAVPNLLTLSSPTLSAAGSKVYAGTFSPNLPFVVKLDPTGNTILYSTYFGGSYSDVINGLTTDPQGNAVVAGTMLSPDFPLTTPATSPPLLSSTGSKSDGFLAKLSADGTRLIFSTAIGASKSVTAQSAAVDSSGAVFLTGQSFATDFPTTPGVFQPTGPAATCTRQPAGGIIGPAIPLGNAYVMKFAADGKTTAYSTLLTGVCGSVAEDIKVDAAGDAILTAVTPSTDFPVTANSYQPSFPSPIDPTKTFGVYTAGFVTKLSSTADKVLASTFLGGGYATQGNAVALDASGNAYITGFTQGIAPGATPGAFQTKFADTCTPTINIGPGPAYTGTGDAFVLKLDPTFSSAGFLSYLGGGCNDSGSHIALDSSGNIWLSGTTTSPDFPLKDPFQVTQVASSQTAGFLSELNPTGSQLLFSSLSEGAALALGPATVYNGGSSGGGAFVARINPAATPSLSVDSVRAVTGFPPLATSPFNPGIAPGQLIQITGRSLGPATKATAQLDAAGRLPFIFANTVVFFDNILAPLLFDRRNHNSVLCAVRGHEHDENHRPFGRPQFQ